ncbi:(2Fe-2S)-binding protein [Candidatus Formimonas warabiya]|uniref:(2Fe-2S)-binding protein n=2 Tax=Formimonas warabiya TaxID=1761012 RepID=A0A3G1KXL5_FORW1|nr:(2Fe-2S)-binding protein [Candidatus Formimonas warabiya]ATW27160.1 (2Fe-2S)-binding protein [Candidatus Formimonas warabiya]
MKRVPIKLKVNGQAYVFDAVPENKTLLSLIRDDIGLTGTKEGCAEGDCGACTVLLNGKTVDSCLVLAVEADGGEVLTIEGLSRDGNLHPIQQAFVDEGSVQCGYCIPGMIMSTYGLLQENPSPTDAEIKKGLEGNICRCTGYVRILNAVHKASEMMAKESK